MITRADINKKILVRVTHTGEEYKGPRWENIGFTLTDVDIPNMKVYAVWSMDCRMYCFPIDKIKIME